MTQLKHTTSAKPIKPRPDFPLFAHNTGRWAKKIRGKMHYFGPWGDPDAAYKRYAAFAAKDEPAAAGKTTTTARKRPSSTLSKSKSPGPVKPWPDFPLYLHPSGQWAKKIRGEFKYFGTDAQAAFRLYQHQKDDLEAGRTPKPLDDYHLNVKDMVNLCLTVKKEKVESGELDRRTFREYERCGRRLVKVLGRTTLVDDLRPTDFLKLRREMAKTLKSLTSIKTDIRKMMVFFNFAYNEGYIDRPIKPGEAFKSPSAAALRRERDEKPQKMFNAKQIRTMLAKADPQLQAMILLGINCAFGNTDCVLLTKNRIDLDQAWIRFPRPKTGVRRHCPLWPETIEALKIVLAEESKYAEYHNRVFAVDKRKPAAHHIDDGRRVSKYFRELLKSIGVADDSPNFYALRHTFVTVAMKSKDRDRDAIRTITGHGSKSRDMLDEYNEEAVADERLLAVVNIVHKWLFKEQTPPSADASGAGGASANSPETPLVPQFD